MIGKVNAATKDSNEELSIYVNIQEAEDTDVILSSHHEDDESNHSGSLACRDLRDIGIVCGLLGLLFTIDLNLSRWLEAHLDRSAGLATLPRNLILADVSGDGDHRLVLTDLKFGQNERSRLKVYKGTVIVSDQTLPDIPSSIVAFYADNFKTPVVGVGCGSELLIYKNNKPFFKFNVPGLPASAFEEDIWKKIHEETARNVLDIVEQLKTVPFNSLSARSQKLLTLQSSEIEEYVHRYANSHPVKYSPITCMTIIKRSTQDRPACPVLATESGQLFILDPQTYTVLHEAIVSSSKATPFILQACGVYDVEFRILVACREGSISLVRRGWLEGKILIQSTTNIVDMVLVPGDNFIIFATTDKSLYCHTKRGNKLWRQKLNNDVTCLCLVPLRHLSTSLVAVGLRGGAVHLYQGRHLVDVIVAPETPSALAFGQMGQEEHVMILVTLGGTINFKILKRTADFNLNRDERTSTPAVQSKPLSIPKRSKMFLEQSMRERQNAIGKETLQMKLAAGSIEMHQNFQKDLIRLRLTAARALVQAQSDQSGIGNETELIKLTAQVLGLGPKFTLILTLENMNNDKPLFGLSVIFHAKPSAYGLSSYLINVPLVPPGLRYKMETKVTERNLETVIESGDAVDQKSNLIRVFVIRKGDSQPVLAATINMPPTDTSAAIL